MVDWIADYYKNIEAYPVKSQVEPGHIFNALPEHAPDEPENFKTVFQDFQQLILPGITHWQSPSFFAYFNANTSFPSIVGEMLTAALGTQCMIWETSPAAAELEEKMALWLQQMLHLPAHWHGVIQDGASTASLCAILTARERHSDFTINRQGCKGMHTHRWYASEQAHASIEKALKIAGVGSDNLVKIPVDDDYAMLPDMLEMAIAHDLAAGLAPVGVVAAIGTTGTLAIDPLQEIAKITQKYALWLHVDAALAGNAAILPECRHWFAGLQHADSFVFNPHKWLFTNFDLSMYYVRDRDSLIRTFSILPEYLKTERDAQVNNYRDWGIQLGRRFRALKLWFVIRHYGVRGLQAKLRQHIALASRFARQLTQHEAFELLAPVHANLVCFRYAPAGKTAEQLNDLNKRLLKAINKSGQAYISATTLRGVYTLRASIGQTHVEQRHIDDLLALLLKCCASIA